MKQIYFKKEKINPYFHRRLPKSLLLARKKRHFKLIILFSLINFFLIIHIIFFSNYFLIKKLEVKGQKDIPEIFISEMIGKQEKKRRFWIGEQANLILFDKNEAIKTISQIVDLEKITIKKNLPDKLIIDIEEKKPVLVLIANNKYYYLDKSGVAIREVNFFSINPYLVVVYNQKNEIPSIGQLIIEDKKINFIFELLEKLPSDIKILPFEISSNKMEVLTLKSKDGWRAIFDPKQELDAQLQNLNLILKNKPAEDIKKIDYFDLRFTDRIYYKE